MTIHQLKDRCWELRPPLSGDDREPHYDSRAEALAAVREAWDDDRDWRFDDQLRVRWRELRFRLSRLRPGASRPRQAPAHCWVVQCDGDCEQVIDEEEEGYTVHHESRQAAGETVRAWKWAYSADGRMVFCEEDAPADGEIPPPSPAELEAAGQMRLPGVLG